MPCWHELIAPSIKSGKRVLIAAHGSSLRALVEYLEDVPADQIVDLNIPTGVPLVEELDDNLKSLRHLLSWRSGTNPAGDKRRGKHGQSQAVEDHIGRV